MYSVLVDWVSQVLNKIKSEKGITSSVNISDKMSRAVDEWAELYAVENKEESLNLAASIAGEYARLITLEMKSDIQGSVRAKFINDIYAKVLRRLRIETEYGCALGAFILKPYISSGKFLVTFVQADSFYPLSFDDAGNITCIVFLDQIKKDDRIYSKFEVHELKENGQLRILNLAYVSKNEALRGSEIPLTDVSEWASLKPDVTLVNVPGNLYGYFRVPVANTVDKKSPLGVSVYSKAVSLIRQADEQYRRILREFEGTEIAVEINEAYLQKDAEGKEKLPKGKERFFRKYAISAGISDKPFYEVFSPEIRDTSLYHGLNEILKKIEYACGLAYGTVSDPQLVEKTATEIKHSKKRSFDSINDCQAALETALRELIQAINILCDLYGIAPGGGLDVSFEWDDSILNDKDSEMREWALMLQELSAGLIKPEFYLAKRYGVTEEEALEMLPSTEKTQTDFTEDDIDG